MVSRQIDWFQTIEKEKSKINPTEQCYILKTVIYFNLSTLTTMKVISTHGRIF